LNQNENLKNNRRYDLADRTSVFGKEVIIFTKGIAISTVNRPIVIQLVRSATSVGANYMEADCAESKKDFRHKISICKKESKEAMYWLDMVFDTGLDDQQKRYCSSLKREAHELTLIFSSIINKL
jgi:four helix bundle protein